MPDPTETTEATDDPPPPRMHEAEVVVDASLVRELLADQLPHLDDAERPLRRIGQLGTDHAIFRMGEDLSVRLPKVGWADGQGEREARWLPTIDEAIASAGTASTDIQVPVPLALGAPGRGYPFRWYVAPWIDGDRPEVGDRDQLDGLAHDLAAFTTTLQQVPTIGGPAPRPGRRGGPLADADAVTRAAIARMRGECDIDALLHAWVLGATAPPWHRDPVWVHGDLTDGNLVLRDGHLVGVIDWSGLVVADPAVDLMCAWSVFDERSRATFLGAAPGGGDGATRLRGRAWAVSAAAQAIPYYRGTNPDIVERSWRTVDAVLAELDRD